MLKDIPTDARLGSSQSRILTQPSPQVRPSGIIRKLRGISFLKVLIVVFVLG
jgi:hypothetical protein